MEKIMKQSSKRRVLSLVLVLAMVFSGLHYGPTVVKAATGDYHFWSVEKGEAQTNPMEKDAISVGTTAIVSTGQTATANGYTAIAWDEGGYWEIKFSTEGYADPRMSLTMGGSDKSPRFFDVTISIDGGSTFSEVTETIELTSKIATEKTVTLPATVADQASVVVRMTAQKTGTIWSAAADVGRGATSQVNNITISDGEPKEPEAEAPEATTAADPISAELIAEVEDAISIPEVYTAATDTVVTVVGQIAACYGNSGTDNTTILQDIVEDGDNGAQIVGLQIYQWAALQGTEYEAGDIVAVTGTVSEYAGVRQIKDVAAADGVKKLGHAEPIPAQELTWETVLKGMDYYLSEYVVFKNAKVGANSKILDSSNTAITCYNAASLPANAVEGDVFEFYCVISKNNTTYQARTSTTEKAYVGEFTGTIPDPDPDPEPDPDPDPNPNPKPTPEPVEIYDPVTAEDITEGVTTIDQIKAAATGVTTVGQIAYKYGKNGTINTTILQDVVDGKVYGTQIYSALSGYEVGDVVKVTGDVTLYGNVPQFSQEATVEKLRSDSHLFAPQEVTLAELLANSEDYVSEYVKIKNVTLGAYDTKNTPITSADGKTINIYQSSAYPEDMKEGDVVTVLGVFSKYNTTYQLRNGIPAGSFLGSVVVDESVTLPAAKWAGSAKVTTPVVYGDLHTDNDRLDTTAKLSLSTGANPAYDNTSTSGTGTVETHIIGSVGLTNGQYYQLEFSSKKLGNMVMSFDMRGSNTGAKYFNVLYSTDGVNYTKADTISYSYSVVQYVNGVASGEIKTEVHDSDKLEVITKQVPYTLRLPNDVADCEKVYVRVQVTDDSTSINGKTIGTSGVNRFMNISIMGNPVVSDTVCGFVKAAPTTGSVLLGQEIALSSNTDGADIFYSLDGENFTAYSAESKPVLSTLPATLTVYAKKTGLADSVKVAYAYTQTKVSTPKISPNGGAVVAGTEVKISTETEGAAVSYSLDEGQTWKPFTQNIKLTEDMFPCTIMAKATLEGAIDSETKSAGFTLRENADYNIYFGQIHSHTEYSDGAGSCETAFDHAKNVAEQIDFLAVTDHSNSFDNDTSATIKDGSVSSEWKEGHELADQFTDDTFVGIMGYEMTWSGGAPGHMNTFNTDGFLSRNMDGYKNGSAASLPNYYGQLKTVPDSMSQFNHPGTTFGDFYDFAHYDSEIDQLITTIEVGNGDGAIGSSGYFPSYEYYTRALDKGWHVAPTNNQDNHKGYWGDANTGRTVVLADSLTRDNIYDAIRNMRMYATEDNDLEIQYTLNNNVMGTIYEEAPDEVNINVKLKDATDKADAKVEVIVNGGLSIASKTVAVSEAEVSFNLKPEYSYYYIRVTQGDGDIAVTAPVWISDVESVGISSISTSASLAVKGEPIDVTTTLYNNEDQDLLVDSIEYSINDKVVHTVDLKANESLAKVKFGETPSYTFNYTHDGLGTTNIYVTVKGTLNGVSKVYQSVLKLSYVDSSMVTRVIVDGTHKNDYVNGYYAGNVGNFADIAAGANVQVKVEENKITKEALDDCSLLVISAPNKNTKNGDICHFEEEFINLVADYVKNGGNVILCGLADYQDTADCQSSTEINKLLEAMGATTRLNSDEMVEDLEDGTKNYRLYFDDFNNASVFMDGVIAGETVSTYSAYSGSSVLLDSKAVEAGKAEALVYGHDVTYSIDSKNYDSNYVEVEKGKIVALGHEEVGEKGGNVFVGGTVFVSNFEVKGELDYAGELTYANRAILLNILNANKKKIAATPIATVRKAEMGTPFAIEGYVTAGTAVEGNIFFDTIYVQDETGGTTIFPIADPGIEIGQEIRIEGFVDAYQGDKELQVISYELLEGEKKVFEPKDITTKEATDYENYGGLLVRVTGTVTSIELAAGDLKYVHVTDESGGDAVVFTDGYILDSTGYTGLINDIKVGSKLSAVGLVYTNPDGVVLRVRDRAEIKVLKDDTPGGDNPGGDNPGGENPGDDTPGGDIPAPDPSDPGSGGNTDVVVPSTPSTDETTTETPEKIDTINNAESVKVAVKTKDAVKVTQKDDKFVDKDGKTVTNAVVKTEDGTNYILDENGKKITYSIVKIVTGEKFITANDGAVVKGKFITVNGNKFYTTKGTGKVVVNKIFKVNGKKYIAAKSGKIYTSKWIEKDGVKYYCNKDGIITKSKKIKKTK